MKKLNAIFELTNKCNLSCNYCMRPEDEKQYYNLKEKDISNILESLSKFNGNEIHVRFSGGEPSLWSDNESTVFDLINKSKSLGFDTSLITNGIRFLDYNYLNNNLNKLDIDSKSISVYVSLDKWHGNYIPGDLSNNILDNLLKYKQEHLNKKINIFVQTSYTRNQEDNMDLDFIKKYKIKGIKFSINPLLPWGKGKKLEHMIPSLSLNGKDKSKLGAYLPVVYTMGLKNGNWENLEEFYGKDNKDILLSFDYCGNHIYFNEKGVYYCEFHNDDFRICDFKEFNEQTYKDFVLKNEWIKCIKSENSLKEFLENCEFIENSLPFDYGKCSICKLKKNYLEN